MKTLINKHNSKIRITTPGIIEKDWYYTLAGDNCYRKTNWELVEEEPVDLEKLALEKCPIQVAYLEGLKKGYELGLKAKKK